MNTGRKSKELHDRLATHFRSAIYGSAYKIQRKNQQMAEGAALFDGTSISDVNHFLFYFENVAGAGSVGESCSRELFTYLRGKAFDFYCKDFYEQCRVSLRREKINVVRQILEKGFGKNGLTRRQ